MEGFYNPPGPVGEFGQGLGSIFNGLLGHTGGYYAGQQDAQFDRIHGYSYNDQPNCLPCHSPDYWNNFRQGYADGWDSYQNTAQSTNVYINNSPGAYVNTAQNSGQNVGLPEPPQRQTCDYGCGGGPDP